MPDAEHFLFGNYDFCVKYQIIIALGLWFISFKFSIQFQSVKSYKIPTVS